MSLGHLSSSVQEIKLYDDNDISWLLQPKQAYNKKKVLSASLQSVGDSK